MSTQSVLVSARRVCIRVITTLTIVTVLALVAAAQKPKTPRMTSDDVAKPPAETPSPESKLADSKPEEKAAAAKAGDNKLSPEEGSWRERVDKAREHAKELEKNTEKAELRITALRNDLGVSGQSSRYRNNTAAEMDQAGQQLADLRIQSRAAAEDLAQLIEYGRSKGYSEAEGPKAVTEGGQPNEEYYRSQYAKLTEAVETAQRRIQLYDDRIRDLNQQLLNNGGGRDKAGNKTGGDSFFAAQLIKDRDEAQQKLDEARAAYTKAQTDIDELREEARRNGVPPGVFR